MKVETQVRLYRKLMTIDMAFDLEFKIALTIIAFLLGLVCLVMRLDLIGGLFVAGAILIAFSSVIYPILAKQPFRVTREHVEQVIAKARAEAKAKG